MKFIVLSLFPEIVHSYVTESMMKRAIESNVIQVHTKNIRDFSLDIHKKTDDTPYGGGPGMVMTCQPIFDAIDATKKEYGDFPVIYFSPHGKRWIQEDAEKYAENAEQKGYILLCGHYEGIDERIREHCIDIEISLGDFVLTGGELPALAFIDSVTRLLKNGIGKEESLQEESFSLALNRKKEYPHYTKPQNFRGLPVPEVLLSGNHKEIELWRKQNCQ
jgi:tRNA (guanine37-N1)-methyltransferase